MVVSEQALYDYEPNSSFWTSALAIVKLFSHAPLSAHKERMIIFTGSVDDRMAWSQKAEFVGQFCIYIVFSVSRVARLEAGKLGFNSRRGWEMFFLLPR